MYDLTERKREKMMMFLFIWKNFSCDILFQPKDLILFNFRLGITKFSYTQTFSQSYLEIYEFQKRIPVSR